MERARFHFPLAYEEPWRFGSDQQFDISIVGVGIFACVRRYVGASAWIHLTHSESRGMK